MDKFFVLDKILPRYMRLIIPEDEQMHEERPNKHFTIHKVRWLPNFYAYPGFVLAKDGINTTSEESNEMTKNIGERRKKDGSQFSDNPSISENYFRMDASSGLAVSCLNIDLNAKNIKVLDLCCCPGVKFQMISSQLSNDSLLVGVDCSDKRIDICKSLMLKTLQLRVEKQSLDCNVPRQLIFHCDGTKFDKDCLGTLRFDSNVTLNDINHRGNRRKKNKSSQKREKECLNQVFRCIREDSSTHCRSAGAMTDSWKEGIYNSQPRSVQMISNSSPASSSASSPVDDSDYRLHVSGRCLNEFDFVLVDAECTHDESYRHMKFIRPTSIGGDKNKNKNKEDEDTGSSSTERVLLKPRASLSYARDHSTASPTTTATPDNTAATSIKIRRQQDPLITLLKEEQEQEQEQVDHHQQKALCVLQRGLLLNGFHLLRPGGNLVYSTCSNQHAQNEDIVQWLLDSESSAAVQPIDLDDAIARITTITTTAPPASCASSSNNTSNKTSNAATTTNCVGSAETSSLEMLQTDSSEGLAYSLKHLSDEQLADLSAKICEEVSALQSPLYTEGRIPGTIRLNYTGAMSGHFIAKITKGSDSSLR